MVYVLSFIFGTLLFVGLFHTRLFRGIDVFFYRGIALLIITCLITLLALVGFRVGAQDIYCILLTIFSFHMLFFTHVPVTADRSVSVFLLRYMNTKHAVSKEELQDVLIKRYIIADKNVEKRIHEQLVSGDIEQTGNGYKLTPRGKRILLMYKAVARLFNLKS